MKLLQKIINKALSSKKAQRGLAGNLPYTAPKSYTFEVQCRCYFASTATRTTGVQTSDTKVDLIALDALQPEEFLTEMTALLFYIS